MEDKEAIEMMQRCSQEIKFLRRQVDALTPMAEAYDVLAKTINSLSPRQGQGMGEDVAWMLDKRIQEIQKSPVNPSPSE